MYNIIHTEITKACRSRHTVDHQLCRYKQTMASLSFALVASPAARSMYRLS